MSDLNDAVNVESAEGVSDPKKADDSLSIDEFPMYSSKVKYARL